MARTTTRRRALAGSFAALTVVAAGGVVWRAWDNGALSSGAGPAYEPWASWRSDPAEGALALVRAGILAANAHNTQPWRFAVSDDRIALYADHDRHLGSFDPYRREMYLSLGCVLENMTLAAAAEGLEASIAAAPGRLGLSRPADADAPAAVLSLRPAERVAGELHRAIPERHTNRGAFAVDDGSPAELIAELQGLVPRTAEMRLLLFEQGATKARLGDLIVSVTEAIIADHEMAADSARWFRFDWNAVQRHRDGVTLDAVGLPPLVTAAAKILPATAPEEADRLWLERTREVHVATAPLLGIIAVRDLYDRPGALAAGRLWQRLHLLATARGLAAQPLNQPPEMVDRERELGAPPATAEALAELTGDATWQPTFVFRLGHAERPARLSPRRPVEAVLAA